MACSREGTNRTGSLEGYRFPDKVMSEAHALPVRSQSAGEEIANAVSHGVGLLLAVVAALALVVAAVQRGGMTEIVGASANSKAQISSLPGMGDGEVS